MRRSSVAIAAPTKSRASPMAGLYVGAILLAAGCASLPGDETWEISGSPVELSQLGAGSPPIVFEAGLGSYKEVWNKVFPALAASHAVFAYDRPGVGRSANTARPRDAATIVEDLRLLLRARRLKPPYILVGHSAGGLYMQLYARKYPDEVAGLVLVDSTHPTQFEGDGDLSHRGALTNAALAVGLDASAKAEFNALALSGREVLAAPPLRANLPVAILVATNRSGTSIAAWDNAKGLDLARFYPGARLSELNVGHDVPQDDPQAVVDAIGWTLEARARRNANGTGL